MKKLLLLLLITCNAFEISFAKKSKDAKESLETTEIIETTSKTPTLIITSIINYTPYDLILVDRSNNNRIHLPAERGGKFSYVIENYRNVTINGSMKDSMATFAQFVLEPINLHDDIDNAQHYYLNFCVIPGGIDDGSGFITGKPGTIISKFFMTGSSFGCSMLTSTIKNIESDEIEIFLEFYIDQSDLKNKNFKISSKCSFIADKNIENPIDVAHKNSTLDVILKKPMIENTNAPIDDTIQSDTTSSQSISTWITYIHENYSLQEKATMIVCTICCLSFLGYDTYRLIQNMQKIKD